MSKFGKFILTENDYLLYEISEDIDKYDISGQKIFENILFINKKDYEEQNILDYCECVNSNCKNISIFLDFITEKEIVKTLIIQNNTRYDLEINFLSQENLIEKIDLLSKFSASFIIIKKNKNVRIINSNI